MKVTIAVAALIGATKASYPVFDNKIPGVCSGPIKTTNRQSGSSSGSGTVNFDVSFDVAANGGKIGGTSNYGGNDNALTGEYRKTLADKFITPPDKALYPFYKPEHTMYWKEDYGGSVYYYTGTLTAAGGFEGFYNADSDAAALSADINADVAKTGTITLDAVTCTVDEARKKAEEEALAAKKDGGKKEEEPAGKIIVDVGPKDYKDKLNLKNHAATSRNPENLLATPAPGATQGEIDAAAAYAAAITDEWTCFSEARKESAVASGKFAVSYTPKRDADFTGPHPAECNVHREWGVECNESEVGTTTVYLSDGAFFDGGAVQEAYCSATYADELPWRQTRTERWCRCAGWYYDVTTEQDTNADGSPKFEQKQKLDDNGDPMVDKDTSDPIMVDNTDKPVLIPVTVKDPEDNAKVMQTVNKEDMWVYNTVKCPIYRNADGEKLEDQTPPHVETNWVQLSSKGEKTFNWMTTCPKDATWVLPVDTEKPADLGSFKGYTNRYTFSAVNDDHHAKGTTVTFNNESDGYAGWTDAAKIGCIGGFAVFGLGIIIVCISIAIDMKRRMTMYEDLIAEDLQKIQQMGMGDLINTKFAEELAARLAGAKDETGVDDQLVTQALELRPEDFSKHM